MHNHTYKVSLRGKVCLPVLTQSGSAQAEHPRHSQCSICFEDEERKGCDLRLSAEQKTSRLLPHLAALEVGLVQICHKPGSQTLQICHKPGSQTLGQVVALLLLHGCITVVPVHDYSWLNMYLSNLVLWSGMTHQGHI